MNVPELKRNLQVQRISVANKRREKLLDFSVKALELAIEIKDEQGDLIGIFAKLVTDDESFPRMLTRSSRTGRDPLILV